MYTVNNYQSKEQFLSRLKEFDVCRNPFQSYAFMSVFLKYFPKGNFDFFEVFEDDKLIGIVPFECTFKSSLLKVRKYRFIGYRQFNYEQYICSEDNIEKVHTAIKEYFAKQSYSVVLNLYDINDSTNMFKLLMKEKNIKSLALYLCPCLHFQPDFEEFFKSIYTSSKKRTELKKFHRKLTELGSFKVINVEDAASYEANVKYINQIYRVHAERFADVYATSFFGEERMRPYYSELIKSLMYGQRGHLSLAVLDDIVIAFVFSLTDGKVLTDWIPAFDPSFAKYNLGIVQYKILFEEMCKQGKYEIFDYSKGSSPYKRKWAKEETTNYQILMTLPTINPFARLLHKIDCFKFSFKVYLRNKGVLAWIKQVIGSIRQKKAGSVQPTDFIVEYAEAPAEKGFSYSSIREKSVPVRAAVLNALYAGEHFVSVDEKDGKTRVVLSK